MNHASTWVRTSDWALARFTRPTATARPRALTIIVAILFAIGMANYVSGIRISLAVFHFVPILLAVAWFGWEIGVGVVF